MIKNKIALMSMLVLSIATTQPIAAAQTPTIKFAPSSVKLGRTGVVTVYATLKRDVAHLSPLLKATIERLESKFYGPTIQETFKKFAYYFANYETSTKENPPEQGS